MHYYRICQFAHAAGLLSAQQVPLARMPAHDLPGGSDLEALSGAAMCFQFLLFILLHNFLFNPDWQRREICCGIKPARPPQDASTEPRSLHPFSAPKARAEYLLPFEDQIPL